MEAARADYVANAIAAGLGLSPRWSDLIRKPVEIDVDAIIEKTIRGLEVEE
jgi:hypothetical protein